MHKKQKNRKREIAEKIVNYTNVNVNAIKNAFSKSISFDFLSATQISVQKTFVILHLCVEYENL